MALMTCISTVEEKLQDIPIIHKRPPKPVACISRARFQKPRPNINPSSKRSDNNIKERKLPEITKAGETKESPEIVENQRTEACLALCISEDSGCISRSNSSLAQNTSPSISTTKEKSVFKISETSHVVSSDKSKINTEDVLHVETTISKEEEPETEDALLINTTVLKENDSVDKSYKESNGVICLNTDLSDKVLVDIIEKASKTVEDISSKSSKASLNKVDTVANSILESPPVLSKQSINCINLEDQLPKRSKPNDVNTTNYPQSKENTDRSSKYPHLTNLLTKKRPEQTTNNKKRKRIVSFDKDKISIGDIIYCNLGSSANPETCSESKTNNEDTSAIVLEETEELDDVDESVDDTLAASVPKLIISQDGEIGIDANSLIVSRKKNEKKSSIASVISENVTYSSFRKRFSRQWSAKETAEFYRALSLVGTDFGLMEKIIPHRNRRELKLKFKREERLNLKLINRAMYEPQTFDITSIEDHIESINVTPEVPDLEIVQPQGGNSKKKPGRKPKAERNGSTQSKTSTNESFRLESAATQDSCSTSSCSPLKSGDDLKEPASVAFNTKRRRKEKTLPPDFVDVDEIEICSEYENSENSTDVDSADLPVPETVQVISIDASDIECVDANEIQMLSESDNIEIIPSVPTECPTSLDRIVNSCATDFPEKEFKTSYLCIKEVKDVKSDEIKNEVCFDTPNNPKSADAEPLLEIGSANKTVTNETSTSQTQKRRRRVSVIPKPVMKAKKVESSCRPSSVDGITHLPVTEVTAKESKTSYPYMKEAESIEIKNEVYLDTLNNSKFGNAEPLLEISPVGNVVATETVTSQIQKRRRRINAIPKPVVKAKKEKSSYQSSLCQLSSNNYTPVEDVTMETPLNFNGSIERKAFQKTCKSLETLQDVIVVQDSDTNSCTIEVDTSSNELSYASDMTTEDVLSNQVVVLAKSPSSENVIHLFMYKNPA